jgi:hypothetical protein
MQSHRGLLSGLVTGALIGLMGNQAHAGAIILSVDLNGTVIYTVNSTAPDNFVSANLAGLNQVLTQAGSAYQFTGTLTATSNFVGSTTVAYLTTTGAINTSGPGTTAAILSVDAFQSGFLLPVPGPGYFISKAKGTYTNAVGTTTYTGDCQAISSLPLVITSPTSASFNWRRRNRTAIAPLAEGFSLSSQFTFNIQQSASFAETFPGTVEVSSVPEPASIVTFLTGMTLPLALAFGFVRRRGACGPVRPRARRDLASR